MSASFTESLRDAGRQVGPTRGGVIIMLLGAASLFGGSAQTTSATPGVSCPQGTVRLAKFEWKNGKYKLESGSGVVISNGSVTGGDWESSSPVSAIVVKGGPGSVTTTYAPPVTSGSFSNAGLPPVGQGNTPDVSNVQFCGPDPKATTTTANATTTTAKATTTTDPKVTTTTAEATTTTDPKATTTTTDPKATTTTTDPKATTTTALVTTTADEQTTTTGATSTTAATTTTVGSSSTSGPSTSVGSSTTAQQATTTTRVEVQGTSVTSTSISADDSVRASGSALAYTGGPSLILVIFGIVLFIGGGSMVAVARLRSGSEG